jgi:hypothetical protein
MPLTPPMSLRSHPVVGWRWCRAHCWRNCQELPLRKACLIRYRIKEAVGAAGHTERSWSRPVSRVLSRTIIPLESPSPATSSGLPGSAGGHPLPLAWRLPYLALLQVGFAVPPNVATGAVRSYRTVSPLPSSLLTLRRFVFCCTFRRLTPPRRYLAPCPQEPGLSSTFREKCSDRPADSGAHHIHMSCRTQGKSPGTTRPAPCRNSFPWQHLGQFQCPGISVVAFGACQPGRQGRGLAGRKLRE